MNLDFFKELKSNLNNNNEVQKLIQELSDYMNNIKERIFKQENDREDGLYYVLNANPDKIYLTKFNSKKSI